MRFAYCVPRSAFRVFALRVPFAFAFPLRLSVLRFEFWRVAFSAFRVSVSWFSRVSAGRKFSLGLEGASDNARVGAGAVVRLSDGRGGCE